MYAFNELAFACHLGGSSTINRRSHNSYFWWMAIFIYNVVIIHRHYFNTVYIEMNRCFCYYFNKFMGNFMWLILLLILSVLKFVSYTQGIKWLHKYKWLITHQSGTPDAWYLNKHNHEWNWTLLQYYSLHWSQLVQYSLVCWLCAWCWPASSAHHSELAAQGQGSCGIAVPLTHLTSVPWFRTIAVKVVPQIMGLSPTSRQHIRQVTYFQIT